MLVIPVFLDDMREQGIRDSIKQYKEQKCFSNNLSETIKKYEFGNLEISNNKIKEKVTNKEVFYDHLADKGSSNRWSDNYKLKKIDLNYLPKYLVENSEKFKDWID